MPTRIQLEEEIKNLSQMLGTEMQRSQRLREDIEKLENGSRGLSRDLIWYKTMCERLVEILSRRTEK